MKLPSSRQRGAALIVALVALVILTVLGVSTMSDVMNQSAVVRNEQFRQKVFYAASSELNAQIDSVNRNAQNEDDVIIEQLIEDSPTGVGMELPITAAAAPLVLTNPDSITLSDTRISGDRRDSYPCRGESANTVKVIVGGIDATATLDDGAGGIQSSIQSAQTQRYMYCWP